MKFLLRRYIERRFQKGKLTGKNFNRFQRRKSTVESADKFAFQMRCEAPSWHHSWSRYYYYKKHFGLMYSLM